MKEYELYMKSHCEYPDYEDTCWAKSRKNALQIFAKRINRPTNEDFWCWKDLDEYVKEIKQKGGKMNILKRIIRVVAISTLAYLILGGLLGVFACEGNGCRIDGVVMDSNDGESGDIFTYDCNKGNIDVGKWVNPTEVPELKGEKGDKGDRGLRGFIGKSGADGEDGATGDKGDTGATGKKGNKGDRGLRGLQGERGKGLDDRYELMVEGRVLDTKRTTWSIYAGRDINNDVNIYGVKVTVKFGKSYEERELEKIKEEIRKIKSVQVANYINNISE